MTILQNFTFDEIEIGQQASVSRRLTVQDIHSFAIVSGDINPAHVDEEYARESRFQKVIAHGMWGGSLISAVLGTLLPGPGTIYLEQSFKFHKPVMLNDEITATVRVLEKKAKNKIVVFECECVNQHDEVVISGQATVIAPSEKIRRKGIEVGKIELIQPDDQFYRYFEQKSKRQQAIRTAVIYPTNEMTLQGSFEAERDKIIEPVYIGPKALLEELASLEGGIINKEQILDVANETEAIKAAIELVENNKADALMKGFVETHELIDSIERHSNLIPSKSKLSQVLIVEIPKYHKPLYITDSAIHLHPDFAEKKAILNNAIDLFSKIENRKPNVAILSALNKVYDSVPSTRVAQKLVKAFEQGEMSEANVEGPMSLDSALSSQAAAENGLISKIAGEVDIVMVPNLEAGNILYKHLRFLADLDGASIVIGAKVPIILPSRPSQIVTRKLSALIAQLWCSKQSE